MRVLHERGAGLDGQQKTVVACVRTPGGQETRTVGTMTADRLALSAWRLAYGCTHAARERPGDDWQPVCNLLEGTFAGRLGNAPQVKAVPGRTTAVKAAAWLAARRPYGVWRASVMPPRAPRARRALPRDRTTCIRERATLVTRVQTRLEAAHLNLAAVASDRLRVSGRARRAALVAGHTAPYALAEGAKGRWRDTREAWVQAWEGRGKPPHRVVWTDLLGQIDRLDE